MEDIKTIILDEKNKDKLFRFYLTDEININNKNLLLFNMTLINESLFDLKLLSLTNIKKHTNQSIITNYRGLLNKISNNNDNITYSLKNTYLGRYLNFTIMIGDLCIIDNNCFPNLNKYNNIDNVSSTLYDFNNITIILENNTLFLEFLNCYPNIILSDLFTIIDILQL